MRKNRWIAAVFLLVLAATAGATERPAADFRLTDWNGSTVTLGDLHGKTVLLTFSYANCSVRCPIVTGRFVGLDQALKSPADIAYVHISVDPDKDTKERRKKYFSLYGIDTEKDRRWIFLSGPKRELAKQWSFYGITARRVKDRRLPEKYYMDYTPKVVLIDPKGVIRAEEDFVFPEDEMVSRVRQLTGTPVARFAGTRYEFGTVKEGTQVRHDFEVTNGGRAILRILDLLPA